ncbi:hypothetical protein ABK040_010392 [Willaertia magna]
MQKIFKGNHKVNIQKEIEDLISDNPEQNTSKEIVVKTKPSVTGYHQPKEMVDYDTFLEQHSGDDHEEVANKEWEKENDKKIEELKSKLGIKLQSNYKPYFENKDLGDEEE